MDQNSRVQRQIITGFYELLKEKSYMDITVTDIVKKAGVSRASYYRNFSSIGDLVDEIVESIAVNFKNEQRLFSSSVTEREWRDFLFRYFYDMANKTLEISTLRPENLTLINNQVASRIADERKMMQNESVEQKYTIPAKFGLLSGICKTWISDGMKEDVEEMVNYTMSLLKKI